MMISMDPGLLISVFFIISIFSFAFKDNPFFRFSQHVYLAASVGNAIVMAVQNIQRFAYIPISEGNLIYLIPCVLGVVIFFQFHSTYHWVSRYAIVFVMGVTLTLKFRAQIKAQVVSQIIAAMGSLTSPDLLKNFSALMMAVATITTLYYFIFIVPKMHTGKLGIISRLGRLMMMIGLGAAFGNTVVTRMKLLIGQLLIIFSEWLGII